MGKGNFIVVGQGIAGTVMAATLLEKGCSVIVIDEPSLSKASRIAAGLYNPVVFKRLVKSWMADELIPFMDAFYTSAEAKLGEEFYHKKKIIKLFAEESEKELWKGSREKDVGKYLGEQLTDFFPEFVQNALGAAEVKDAGNLNSSVFLNSFRNFFLKKGMLLEEKFDHKKLNFNEGSAHYKDLRADMIIFCEGYRALENPLFTWLPFKLTKGEIITIKLSAEHKIPVENVINKGVFILPIGNDAYKVGATYEWNELDEQITEKGKTELVSKLDKVLKVSYEIIDHQAGIRPTVNDRRPLIGLHPEHKNVAVFNGMGTKAVMLAPYFADQLAEHLIHGSPIDKEADLARFK